MPQQTNPESFRAFMVRELATFQELARAQNIVVE
jgi:type VI protein secretion system component VasF